MAVPLDTILIIPKNMGKCNKHFAHIPMIFTYFLCNSTDKRAKSSRLKASPRTEAL